MSALIPLLQQGAANFSYGNSQGGVVNPNGGLMHTSIVAESPQVQALRAKAKFIGKWVDHTVPYWANNSFQSLSVPALVIINTGYLETQTTGTYVEIDLIHNNINGLPFVSWEINGILQQTLWLPDLNQPASQIYTITIPCQPNDIVRFHIEGLGDGDQYDMWHYATGESIVDIRSNGALTPTPSKPTVLVLGDSIGEGGSQNFQNLFGQSKAQSGRTCWSSRVCDMLGYDFINGAFGATGITHGGGRGVPEGIVALANHYEARPNQNMPKVIDVFDAHGNNDVPYYGNNNMSSEDYKVVYTAYVNAIIAQTGVKPICCIPFNAGRKPEKLEVAAQMGLKVIDMSLWGDISTTDTVHPNVNGHLNAALHFVKAYKRL